MIQIFEQLEIYGIPEQVQLCVLASLLTGNPILLIGDAGSAKTEIFNMLGSAFREYSKTQSSDPKKWFTFHAYDCSKLSPEELIGFIDIINRDKNGHATILPGPSTIYGKKFVCFDEFNRVDTDRQSNLFEIIRHRRCMGIPTDTDYIINCMNPFGDAGTLQLSDALIDRHMFYVKVPACSEMEKSDTRKIINRMGSHDSLGLSTWNKSLKSKFIASDDPTPNPKLAEIGRNIREILERAATMDLLDVTKEYGDIVDDILLAMVHQSVVTDKNKWSVSGRRVNMLKTGMLSLLAIQKSLVHLGQGASLTPTNIMSVAVKMGMPALQLPKKGTDAATITAIGLYIDKSVQEAIAKQPPDKVADILLLELSVIQDPYEKILKIRENKDVFNHAVSTTSVWENIKSSQETCLWVLAALDIKEDLLPVETRNDIISTLEERKKAGHSNIAIPSTNRIYPAFKAAESMVSKANDPFRMFAIYTMAEIYANEIMNASTTHTPAKFEARLQSMYKALVDVACLLS